MRLIDVDALLKEYDGAEYTINKSAYARGCNDVIAWSRRTISEAPTIDAVSVVRCKDCKWFYESDTEICCTKHTGLALARKDDYCSYGERIK